VEERKRGRERQIRRDPERYKIKKREHTCTVNGEKNIRILTKNKKEKKTVSSSSSNDERKD